MTVSKANIAVSVSTLWTDKSSPRATDARALGNPVDVPAWLAAMSADRKGLMSGGLTQTQALYGDQVAVLNRRDGWCEITVPGQTTPKNDRGYPGWVPADQLVTDPEFAERRETAPFAQVDRAATTVLCDDAELTVGRLWISAGTCLPVLAEVGAAIKVAVPSGEYAWLPTRDVSVYRSARDLPRPTGVDLATTAALFLDLPYLWGGRCGKGIDCSGLTSLVYQIHGIQIPRDACDQSRQTGGQVVDVTDLAGLQPGDLLFYTDDEDSESDHITHVSMYVGDQRMIEACDGFGVRITEVRTDFLAGGRRFVVKV